MASVIAVLFGTRKVRAAIFTAHSRSGNRAYPDKQLMRRPCFHQDVHEHMMGIRNTLVAHDDMESIAPRLLATSITGAPRETTCLRPVGQPPSRGAYNLLKD